MKDWRVEQRAINDELAGAKSEIEQLEAQIPPRDRRGVPAPRRQEARPGRRARRRRLVLRLPRQDPPGRDADPQAGSRDHLLRQLQADPLLRAAELVKRARMPFRAFIDGAARGNPGPAGAGVYVSAEDHLPAEEHFEALGHQTNNVAEYRALLLALRRAAEREASEVSIASDSLLLVQQMLGRYRVKAPQPPAALLRGARAREGLPPLLHRARPARGQQEGGPAGQSRSRRERARHGRRKFQREP